MISTKVRAQSVVLAGNHMTNAENEVHERHFFTEMSVSTVGI